jgi:TPP-dependent pyruvate/acetoin dehydrogenase alpha subunit
MLLDNKVTDADELKKIEKDIRKEVQDALKKAKVTCLLITYISTI